MEVRAGRRGIDRNQQHHLAHVDLTERLEFEEDAILNLRILKALELANDVGERFAKVAGGFDAECLWPESS